MPFICKAAMQVAQKSSIKNDRESVVGSNNYNNGWQYQATTKVHFMLPGYIMRLHMSK